MLCYMICQAGCYFIKSKRHADGCIFVSGRRSSTIVAVRQFRDRDSASSTAKKAGNEADQQSTELLDKANAYVDELKVP